MSYKVTITVIVSETKEGSYGYKSRDGSTEGKCELEYDAYDGNIAEYISSNTSLPGLVASAMGEHLEAVRESEKEEQE